MATEYRVHYEDYTRDTPGGRDDGYLIQKMMIVRELGEIAGKFSNPRRSITRVERYEVEFKGVVDRADWYEAVDAAKATIEKSKKDAEIARLEKELKKLRGE